MKNRCSGPDLTLFWLLACRLCLFVGLPFQRLTIDIKDLDLTAVPSLQRPITGTTGTISHRPFLSVSKHLCGVATDLMLRCMNHYNHSGVIADTASRDSPLCRGGAVALCCHHLCSWRDYVGKSFLENELRIGATDFQRLLNFSHWTAIKTPNPSESTMTEQQTVELKQRIGRLCKRIIDYGRLAFLQSTSVGYGQSARLVHYCSPAITPENCLLVFGGTPI